MRTRTVTLVLDEKTLAQLDEFVASHVYRSRQDAITKILRRKVPVSGRLARECAKLEQSSEQAMAEGYIPW